MATNQYGLDVDYFRRLCAREFNPETISNQTPEDLARALARAARTACAEVLQEPEFQPARQAPADGVVVSLADLRAACLGSEQEAAKGLNRLRALLAQQAQGGCDD